MNFEGWNQDELLVINFLYFSQIDSGIPDLYEKSRPILSVFIYPLKAEKYRPNGEKNCKIENSPKTRKLREII